MRTAEHMILIFTTLFFNVTEQIHRYWTVVHTKRPERESEHSPTLVERLRMHGTRPSNRCFFSVVFTYGDYCCLECDSLYPSISLSTFRRKKLHPQAGQNIEVPGKDSNERLSSILVPVTKLHGVISCNTIAIVVTAVRIPTLIFTLTSVTLISRLTPFL